MEHNVIIKVDESNPVPIYKQITEQIKQSIAAKRLQAGERLPSIRELARSLNVTPGTVARAYIELEQDKIIVSRRGGGTTVIAYADDPEIHRNRRRRLANLINNDILEALSLGYSPGEIEAMFSVYLSRWREEQSGTTQESDDVLPGPGKPQRSLTIVASHDMALNLLISKFKTESPGTRIELSYAGSLGGLIALQEHRAGMAGIHLLDEETGEYNYPYIRHLLPGRKLAVVHLAYRIQGLIFAKHSAKRIMGLEDLRRSDLTFINRQSGSGTRVLLDFELHRRGIDPTAIKGYNREVNTHDAVALSISHGTADVGLGIEAAAQSADLDFLPLVKERYDLVFPEPVYRSKMLAPLIKIVKSPDFKAVVASVGGYDTSETGTVTLLE